MFPWAATCQLQIYKKQTGLPVQFQENKYCLPFIGGLSVQVCGCCPFSNHYKRPEWCVLIEIDGLLVLFVVDFYSEQRIEIRIRNESKIVCPQWGICQIICTLESSMIVH